MYEDRDYSRSSAQGAGGWRRLLPQTGNLFEWALPVARVFGVTVRLHLLFLLFILFELARAAFSANSPGLPFIAMGLICGFGCVLIHEFGHVFACRAVGGEADDILLWPLGGLAACRPPHTWKASLITTLGGPLVHPILVVPTVLVILAMGGSRDAIIFNPFDLNGALAAFWRDTGSPGDSAAITLLKTSVWWFYYTNLMLFCFNMLLPMFPMDAGRVVQEILWSRIGYRKSMKIAATTGIVVASLLGVYAVGTNTAILLGLALFAGLTCWSQLQRIRFESAEDFGESRFNTGVEPGYARALAEQQKLEREEETARERRQRELARQREEAAKHQDELDRILAKISREGMAALTRSEKKFLEQDTTRRREAR